VEAWSHLAKHREEIVWAVALAIPLAVICAVIVDAFALGSRSRETLRHFRNRMAEESSSRLAKRIEELREYQKRLSSDRWLYLFSFQCIFLTLVSFSAAGIFLMLTQAYLIRPHPELVFNLMFLGVSFICFGGGFAFAGLRHVYRDTPEKMQGLVRKVGHEIEDLEKKLAKRSER
jgi:hypothetical protein